MPIHLKLLIACFVWGATPTFGRVLSVYEAPFVIVCGRFLIAFALLAIIVVFRKQFVVIPKKYWLAFLALGATGIFLHNGLMFKGLEYTSASVSSVLLSCIAVQVVCLEVVFYRKMPDVKTVLGILLAVFGTFYVISDGDLSHIAVYELDFGTVLILLSGFSWALYSLLGSHLLVQFPSLIVTTLATFTGLLFLVPFLFADLEMTLVIFSDLKVVSALFVLGVLGSAIGFLWYYDAVHELGTIKTAVYINLVPVFGIGIAAFFLDEKVGSSLYVGAVLVLGGVFLVNSSGILGGRNDEHGG